MIGRLLRRRNPFGPVDAGLVRALAIPDFPPCACGICRDTSPK